MWSLGSMSVPLFKQNSKRGVHIDDIDTILFPWIRLCLWFNNITALRWDDQLEEGLLKQITDYIVQRLREHSSFSLMIKNCHGVALFIVWTKHNDENKGITNGLDSFE